MNITDPVEKTVAVALEALGIPYTHEKQGHGQLDFMLENGVMIECKAFHADRVTKQLSAHPDVILIQGYKAAKTFANLILNKGKL